jgi:hypothetical protein
MIDFKKPAPRGTYEYLTKPVMEPEVYQPVPPAPPEHGGGGPIHITIEMIPVQRQAPPPRKRPNVWTSLLLSIALGLAVSAIMGGCAHAEEWHRSGEWHGSSFRFKDSNTTYHDWYGPNGESRHCTSFRFKDSETTYTDCR